MPAPLRRRKLMGEINVVPYIDVMLVLLVIFMITAPLLKEGVKVDLPDAGAKPIDPEFLAKHEPLIVTIDARGRLYVHFGQNPDKPASEATVSARPRRALPPRSSDSRLGQSRPHGALGRGGACHGVAATCGRDEGRISNRSRAASAARGQQWSRRRRRLNAGFLA